MLLVTTKGQKYVGSYKKNVYSLWIPALRNNFTLGVSVTDESNEVCYRCNHHSGKVKNNFFLNFV